MTAPRCWEIPVYILYIQDTSWAKYYIFIIDLQRLNFYGLSFDNLIESHIHHHNILNEKRLVRGQCFPEKNILYIADGEQ